MKSNQKQAAYVNTQGGKLVFGALLTGSSASVTMIVLPVGGWKRGVTCGMKDWEVPEWVERSRN